MERHRFFRRETGSRRRLDGVVESISIVYCACGESFDVAATDQPAAVTAAAALLEAHISALRPVPYPYTLDGRACKIARRMRTNNAGGRQGRAWYWMLTIAFEDGIVERMPMGEFMRRARPVRTAATA